jgi:hypothetical protein
MLDLSARRFATRAPLRALALTGDASGRQQFHEATQEGLCAGVIQSCEVACEQSWTMIRREPLRKQVGGALEPID